MTAVLLTMLLVLPMTFPGVAQATGGGMGCNPGRSPAGGVYHDGSDDATSYEPGGVYSKIYVYSPWVTSGSLAFGYSMLINNTNGNLYSQVGWLEGYQATRNTFTEQGLGTGSYDRRTYAPLPIGNAYYYTVDFDPNNANNAFTWYANGTFEGSYPNTFPPNAGELSAERHNNNDQTAGGYNHKAYFSDSHIYDHAGSGSWVNYTFNDKFYNANEDSQSFSGTTMYTWDLKCPN